MSAEKRKFNRMQMDQLAEFREYDLQKGDSALIPSNLKNVSGSGVLFETENPLEVGTLIKMKLKIPGWEKYKSEFIKPDWKSTSEPLVTLGYVARVEETEKDESYETGVDFVCMDEKHKQALMQFIDDTQ